ncbi:hypothetical protein BJ166DRAFT_93552 [Pestalotiopsis sp. NC0098]|nr:hypothetical protein BJ166DRAFT_93552 [Pestalotiopsis sp. NC0098]
MTSILSFTPHRCQSSSTAFFFLLLFFAPIAVVSLTGARYVGCVGLVLFMRAAETPGYCNSAARPVGHFARRFRYHGSSVQLSVNSKRSGRKPRTVRRGLVNDKNLLFSPFLFISNLIRH